jgi:hypothetical protein
MSIIVIFESMWLSDSGVKTLMVRQRQVISNAFYDFHSALTNENQI